MTTAPPFITRKEACALLACSYETLRKYRRAGRIRWRWHVNGRWREYDREDCARVDVQVFRGEPDAPRP